MRVFCDFDGAITLQDSTDFVLETLADPQWRVLQTEWEAGRMSGAECMRGQVAMIGGSRADLDAALDAVEMDPGFPDFVAWSEAQGLPLKIVSDGVDYFIARILARHGLGRLPVVANRLVGEPGAWRLEHPPKPVDCGAGSGVCKCAAVAPRPRGGTVYVGDGRSDFCVSAQADLLFAKGVLADHARDASRPYLPFDTFHDVKRTLAGLLDEPITMLPHAASV
jgi:2,3-diketo-5-methylthio-1-phosphopentane phosphatase